MTIIPAVVRHAHHEAGHAIVDMFYGTDPALIWVCPERGGRCLSKPHDNPLIAAISHAAGDAGEAVGHNLWDVGISRRNRELASQAKPISEIVKPSIDTGETITARGAIAEFVSTDACGEVAEERTDFARISKTAKSICADALLFHSFCARYAKRIIESNFQLWDLLVVSLLERGILYADDIDRLKTEFSNVTAPDVQSNAGAILDSIPCGEGNRPAAF